MSTFLDRLEQELLAAGRRRQRASRSRGLLRGRSWRLAVVPVLVAVAALVYVVAGSGSSVSGRLPKSDSPSGYQYQATPGKPRLVGSKQCIDMAGGRVRALVQSQGAPDPSLTSQLSLLRNSAGTASISALGNWDRRQYPFATIFTNYIRIVDGPRNVKLGFFPATFCNQTDVSGLGSQHPVVREAFQQGIFMLVLSNPGEHPPVLVGTAAQIEHGPGLAGLDLSDQRGWVQAIVVPDGVTRAVMKFTPPFLHHYSNTVTIQSNVGIVVRRPDYSPTTVAWYGANGHLIKRFVFHKEISDDNCLHAHKKLCGVTAPTHVSPPSHQVAYGPPALMKQATALDEPLETYEHATTAAQRARSRAAGQRVGTTINPCDGRYSKQLFLNLNLASKQKAMRQRVKLYELWNHVSMMQIYQADVAPVASQLAQLASSWQALSLKNQVMNGFVHAVAAELEASLTAPPIDTCAFVQAVAAHHFSYNWARNSSFGRQATHWWAEISTAGNRTASFWRYVQPPKAGKPDGPGLHLFTQAQLIALGGLPGELG